MTFETTTDYQLITSILTNPRAYECMRNDSSPKLEAFAVEPMRGVRWVVGWVRSVPVAAIMLIRNRKKAQIHFCIVPQAWGVAHQIAEKFLGWVWRADRQLQKLVALVPSHNRPVVKMAHRHGWRYEATAPNQGTKRGKPFDIMMFVMERPRGLTT